MSWLEQLKHSCETSMDSVYTHQTCTNCTTNGNHLKMARLQTALQLLGVIDSNAVSQPLRPLDAAESARVRDELELAGLL